MSLQCVGFVHGTQTPGPLAPPVQLKLVQQSESAVQLSGLMQHAPPAQTCPGGQHAPPHVVVPVGQTHWHVELLNTCPGPHVTHAPVLEHVKEPGGQVHVAVAGSQKLLQHSELSLHFHPPFLQRPMSACAGPAPTSDRTPPAAAVPASLKAWRRDFAP